MKTRIIPFLIAASLTLTVQLSQAADKYTETMQKTIEAVYAAESIPDLQNSVNTFERIASAEKTKWEPYYYASFGYIMMSTKEKDGAKIDSYLDQALTALNKGKELAPAESEFVALEGFVHMMRVTVDPASRGQKYSGMSFQAFGKAVAMNPENPRALSLLAQMQFGTAKFFGSSTDEACGTVRKALEKFASFKSDNPLAPRWGLAMTEQLTSGCK